MQEVTFSDQSNGVLNTLSPMDQMPLIEGLSNFKLSGSSQSDSINAFQREGTTFYRLRIDPWRLYFSLKANNTQLYCQYIIHKHTLNDFVFRSKLPVNEEHMVEKDPTFWQYLETLIK